MNPVPFMPIGAATVRHRQILRVEFTPPNLQAPVFDVSAPWLRLLGPALARSGVSPDVGHTFVMIRLLTPATESGEFSTQAEAIDNILLDAIVAALASEGWETSAAGVSIREEAHARSEPLLEVAIYGIDDVPDDAGDG